MKTINSSLFLLLTTSAVWAQQPTTPELKTLVGPSKHIGFFGATTTQYTRVAGEDALALNACLGVTFNRTLSVGLGGTALTNGRVPDNSYRWPDLRPNSPNYLAAAYGGLYIEPQLPSNSVVHMAFPVLIGGGSATNEEYRDYRHDEFFVVEPGATVEVNVAKFLVLGVGATYRYTSCLDLPGTSRTALNGFAGGITLKVGRF